MSKPPSDPSLGAAPLDREILDRAEKLAAWSDPSLGAAPLDRENLIARFDGIRQFARGGRWAPHKPLLLLYALASLKHDP